MCPMPRSMLVYRALPEDLTACAATIIALHDRGGNLEQLAPLCRPFLDTAEVITPQAARTLDLSDDGRDGEHRSCTWYFGGEPLEIEPATFGESLWQLEQMAYDVRDRNGADRLLFLLGYGQGAVLAATLGGVLPDMLAGVVAVRGFIPQIRGWSMPAADLNGLPVLMIHDPNVQDIPFDVVSCTAEELRWRGGSVDVKAVFGVARDVMEAAPIVSEWIRVRLTRGGVA